MIQFLATTQAGCRRSFPLHLLYRITALAVSACAALIALVPDTPILGAESNKRPNIVLVMADDQGWAQTGYYDHPALNTPHLDAMADSGLRFDRFYAGAPVCSPTRASVLTGRTNDRTGVESHGYALRRQEITIASLLRQAGYVTGHFGKWHLNGLRGPGVPILATDDHHPGHFGFDHWLSVTNFFDRDPIMSRMGEFVEFQGDSSEIIVEQALKFIERQRDQRKPSLTVVWYGTPHSPFKAAPKDAAEFDELDKASMQHYGELVALDRSIGTLRGRLRELGISDNTLVWYCSDNGGLPKIEPSSVGPLRGNKGTIYEGGLRVPGIIEWPAVVTEGRTTAYPACVLDILPTLLDITGVEYPSQRPVDGISLKPLLTQELATRDQPIPFRHIGRAALIDNRYKLLTNKLDRGQFELYDLAEDQDETNDLAKEKPEMFQRMKKEFLRINRSIDDSVAGKDYPEGRVNPDEPKPRFWTNVEAYEPYFDDWRQRWEYASRLAKRRKGKQ